MPRSQFPDLSSLEIFSEIASGHTFTETAKKMGITISAVSQAMAQLERDMGVGLLDRNVRPVALTPCGRSLARLAAPILLQAKDLKRAVKPAPDHYPVARVGLAESVSHTIAPWIISGLSDYVGDLSAKTGMTKTLLQNFTDDKLDVLVSAAPVIDAEGAYREEVYRESFFVVYPASWKAAVETPQDVHALASQYPLVRYNALASDRIQTERIFRREGIDAKRIISVESSYTMMGLVAQGAGWAFMPPFNIWHGEVFSGAVRFARPETFAMSRAMWVVALNPEFEGLVKRMAALIREIVEKQMKPRLSQISEALAAGVETIAG